MEDNYDISEFSPYKFMTKEVFAQYKEIEQKIKGLREKLSGNHDKEIEDELVRTENIRISLEHEYDWQDRIFDDEKGLFGIEDVVGHVLISPQWDDIYPELSYQDHQFMPYAVCKDGKWGVMMADGKNQLLCKLEYDSIDVVEDEVCGFRDYFVICKEGKYGLMDFQGVELLPCKMENITPRGTMAIIEHNGKYGMVTFNGHIIMPEYDIIEFDADVLMLPALKDGKWGLLNNTSGEFTVNKNVHSGDAVGTLTVFGITLEECTIEDAMSEQKIRFRLKEPLKNIMNRVDRAQYPLLEDYVDILLNTKVTTSQSTTIPLAGNVIPSDRDFVDKNNLPTSHPLYCDSLKEWQDRIAVSKCYDMLFDWSQNESEKSKRPSWRENLGDNALIFPKDTIPGHDGQWAYIKDGKWGVYEFAGQNFYGYDELRGVYPGRLHGRKGTVWEDIESGWIGQSPDARYFYGFLHLWDYLDGLLGDRNGHYIASEIEKLLKDKKNITYSPRNYEVIDKVVVDGVNVLKVKNDFMLEVENEEDQKEYYYMLDAPLMEVFRKREKLELDLSSLDEYGDITRKVYNMEEHAPTDVHMNVLIPTSLLPHPEDISLYYHAKHERHNEGLSQEIQCFYERHYKFRDITIIRNGKMGVCDCLGHVVIDPIYDEVTPISDMHNIPRGAMVKENGKTAFALRSMTKPEEWYDDIDYNFGLGHIPVRNGKKGLIDEYLEVIIPCELDEIYHAEQGCALIKNDGLWGLISSNFDGDEYVYTKAQFEDWKGHRRFMVKKDGMWGYLNKFGKFTFKISEAHNYWPLLGPAYCFIGPMDELEGKKPPHTDTVYSELIVEKGKLIPHTEDVDEFIKQYEMKLEEFTSSQVDEYLTLEEQLRAYRKHIDYSAQIFEEMGKYGVKNSEGNVIIQPLYDEIRKNSTSMWSYNVPVSARKGNKWALVSQTGDGQELTPFDFDKISFLGVFNGFKVMRNGEEVHLNISGEEDGKSAVLMNDFM